ncbi:MAG: pyridoxal phosphate-dependent decarboxylase family protein [Bacteroidales bacterium]
MIHSTEFRKFAHELVDWIADYIEAAEDYPVKSQVKPREIFWQLPNRPPLQPEPFQEIFDDFQKIIMPGVTHWQSPNFYAYFPANSSYPSILAEMLIAALGAQCMVWETSPAAAELEEKVMDWLKEMTGIPSEFHGVIQDTASTATLVALLTAREKHTGFQINDSGFQENNYRIYCSSETHSSIEKGAKIAGFGRNSVVKVDVDSEFRMDVQKLEKAILADKKSGLAPVCIVATLGTTGSTAIDPLQPISEIAAKYRLWLHVDAAYAGTALILDEFKWMIEGINNVDSFVINPHKWMMTNFDCSAYFVKDREALIKTFSINPEYLKTKTSGMVNDYRDWGIQLGRRFRALKLWFVIRSFGVEGLRERLRSHIEIAKLLASSIDHHPDYEIVAPGTMNLVCFRYKPIGITNEQILNKLNERLLHTLNDSGKLYLSHTKLNGKFTLRMVVGQTRANKDFVMEAWRHIGHTAENVLHQYVTKNTVNPSE